MTVECCFTRSFAHMATVQTITLVLTMHPPQSTKMWWLQSPWAAPTPQQGVCEWEGGQERTLHSPAVGRLQFLFFLIYRNRAEMQCIADDTQHKLSILGNILMRNLGDLTSAFIELIGLWCSFLKWVLKTKLASATGPVGFCHNFSII